MRLAAPCRLAFVFVLAPCLSLRPPPLVARRFRCGVPRMQSEGSGIFGSEMVRIEDEAPTFMMGVDIKQRKYKTLKSTWTIDDSLDELERLCETANLRVLGRDFQALQHPSAGSFLGSGKVQELRETVELMQIRTVVFDDELTPAQGRNLQEALGGEVQVIDRTMLILHIFAQRARTKEAKLQVAAAQMKYMLPRLQYFMTTGAGMDAKGGGASSGGGGQFLKGAGESQLESDKRLFRKQILRIEGDIAEVARQREQYRAKRRKRDTMPLIAIVGYTNAGKSSLLNKLCAADQVYADDLLFATLDPTSRCLALPGGKEILLSDTVGFIQKLPTKLVSAFRSTLEEVEDASLVLHVVDASSPIAKQQVWSVMNILQEVHWDSDRPAAPQILVLNKMDAVSGSVSLEHDVWSAIHEGVTPVHTVPTSVREGLGLTALLQTIERVLLEMAVRVDVVLPYSEGDLVAEAHKDGTVLEEEFAEEGTRLVAYVPPSLRNKMMQRLGETGPRQKPKQRSKL